MKAVHLVLLLSLPVALAASEVRTGDSFSDVRANLGVPRGQVKVGDRQLLYYDRGEVELQSGAVTRVALLSTADFAALEAKRAADAARRNEENVRLSAEGESLKARKLSDPSFLATPLAYQIAFWQDFSRRYPGVPVVEQLLIARARLDEQFAERQAEQDRLAELEARVNAVESSVSYAGYSNYGYGGYGYSGGYGYYGGNGYYAGQRIRHSNSSGTAGNHFSNNFGQIVPPFHPGIVTPFGRSAAPASNNSSSNRGDSRGSNRGNRM